MDKKSIWFQCQSWVSAQIHTPLHTSFWISAPCSCTCMRIAKFVPRRQQGMNIYKSENANLSSKLSFFVDLASIYCVTFLSGRETISTQRNKKNNQLIIIPDTIPMLFKIPKNHTLLNKPLATGHLHSFSYMWSLVPGSALLADKAQICYLLIIFFFILGIHWIGLSKNGPQRSRVWMLSHQGMELFERIRRIRRCGLAGKSVLPGVSFEVSESQFQVSLTFCGPGCSSSAAAPAPACMFSMLLP